MPIASETGPAATIPRSPEPRDRLVLRAWEAISAERDLQSVLSAVADFLVPVVPFAAIGIVSFEGGRHDLYALHIVGNPLYEGETLEQFHKRQPRADHSSLPARTLIPYPPDPPTLARPIFTCDDLMAKQDWYEHEFHLAASGVRAYTSIPLIVRGQTIGVASFTRMEAIAYTGEELTVLSDVSRAIGVAVANALANEEIRKLRDQLAEENIGLRAQLGQTPWFEGIVGDSERLRRVLEAVDQVAGTGATVLITGETGTGKELIARAIHRRSSRAHGPLVQVNCSAVPDTLLASELFGHERGAFTGAVGRRKGRFEQAHGGTLFLDEVGDLPHEAQIMLLRVLQEREFERVGGNQTLRVDVSLVAATNRDLAEDVRAGNFRSDLYYRLNVFPIHVPPLRERPEDIPLLVEHFAVKYGTRFGRSIARIDRRTMSLLESYDWPGNVRELENVVERAVIISRNGTLRVERDTMGHGGSVIGDLDAQLKTQEREMIETALTASRGRVSGPTGAATRLRMPASTVEFRIKRLGIDKFQYRRRQL
jgi:formate hydrogenlyase transcriptional activator